MGGLKGILLLLAVIVLLPVTAGCGTAGNTQITNKEEAETEEGIVKLTQRQKDILEQVGLPTEFEELDLIQESAIQCIEQMLDAVEKKHGKTFCYLEYVPKGILDQETLKCYEEGILPQTVITVERVYENNEWIYSDNYREVQASKIYADMIRHHIEESRGENCCVVFSDISALRDEENEGLLRSGAVSRIYLPESSCTEEMLKKTAEELKDWLAKHYSGSSIGALLYVVEQDVFEAMAFAGYEDETGKKQYLHGIMFEITGSGPQDSVLLG